MKKLLLILLLPFYSLAQDDATKVNFPLDSTRNISFSEVIKVENTDAQTLYSRAKLFIAEAYKSNKDVTQLNDDAAKIVLIKPVIKNIWHDGWVGTCNGYTSYQLKIECKDGKYRYTLNGLIFHETSYGLKLIVDNIGSDLLVKPKDINEKNWNKIQLQSSADIKILISILKSKMIATSSDF